MMRTRPRFIADAMLGALARWLRLLGFDTAYDPRLDDAALVSQATSEERLLLTRDRRLVERRDLGRWLLVEAEELEPQLLEVVSRLALDIERSALFSRCLRCNEPLAELSGREARARVPPFVAATQDRFRSCPVCRRLYWRATHVERMEARLEALGLMPTNDLTPP